MDIQDLMRQLHTNNGSKIVMVVADGLGGLPLTAEGLTELETAQTPHLDQLAVQGVQGGSIPVLPGITPGSGPGHLALFGYDPLKYVIGRGALEATGVGLELQVGDVAVRCNFCTLDQAAISSTAEPAGSGRKRAGRWRSPSAKSPLRAWRSSWSRSKNTGSSSSSGARAWTGRRDTDPQATGVPPLDPVAHDPPSEKTAEVAIEFLRQAGKILAGQPKANFLTMRGFAGKPHLPTYREVYGLRAAAVAVYPMYKGLARLVGMEIVGEPSTLDEQIDWWSGSGRTSTSSSSTSNTPTARARTGISTRKSS